MRTRINQKRHVQDLKSDDTEEMKKREEFLNPLADDEKLQSGLDTARMSSLANKITQRQSGIDTVKRQHLLRNLKLYRREI